MQNFEGLTVLACVLHVPLVSLLSSETIKNPPLND